MSTSYDVIVIGSGAGGGTLVHRLAPSGKRILLLERGGWLPREPQNWLAHERLRRQPLHLAGHVVRRRRQAVPAAGALLRRRRHQALRRRAVPAARRGLRRAAPPRRLLARVADRLRRDGALLHARPSGSTRCTARAARTRPSRRRARPTRSRRSRTSRASSSSTTTSRRPATIRSTRPAASCSTSATCRYSACVRCATCDGFPCLVHAKSDAEVLAVRPALEHPNVTLLTGAEAVRLETNAPGTAVTGVVVERDGDARDLHRRHRRRLLRRRQQRQAAARLGERRAPATAWPTAPTRSGATTCSTTARPCSRCRKEPNPTVFQKTLGPQRLLLRRPGRRLPARQHPDGRQVVGRDVPRREAAADQARAAVDARRGRARTPSTSGSRPRTCRCRRTA